MGIRLPSILLSKQFLKHGSSSVPKGYCTVYAGEEMKKRYVIPISYLNHPCFQKLLREAEEEFGYGYGHLAKKYDFLLCQKGHSAVYIGEAETK